MMQHEKKTNTRPTQESPCLCGARKCRACVCAVGLLVASGSACSFKLGLAATLQKTLLTLGPAIALAARASRRCEAGGGWAERVCVDVLCTFITPVCACHSGSLCF